MNREMILKVADAIETAGAPEAQPALGFNMGDWISNQLIDNSGHDCGTTACIAGWAVSVSGRDVANYNGEIRSDAEHILGLDYDTAEELFVNYPIFSSPSPSQAAEVLRRLAETGVVDWSAVIESSE